MLFYTKNKEKEAKRNEINFLKNYFVTVSFIFAINGHNIYVLINNNTSTIKIQVVIVGFFFSPL